MPEDVIRLERNGLIVDVSPLGGAILSAHWHGVPILAPTPSPGLASHVLGAEACFPLIPFGNRIENNSFHFEGQTYVLAPNTADPLVLHGDGWLKRWSILRQTRWEIVFCYAQEASNTTPFAYETTQTIALGDDRLSLSLTVTNRASRALPYGLGFHPYFPRTPETRLFAEAANHWSEREHHLPGSPGPVPPDMNFASGAQLPADWINNALDGWNGRATIEWPETGMALSIDADSNFKYFVLYSPSAESSFFCFEPMTHLPNAHQQQKSGGLSTLARGEQLAGKVVLLCRKVSS
ncbi:aldose 1-epimerase [Shinella kummerowiae]|jgi:aldose 1-epimerase|uniref:Aldose 1-epimerase n=1 Tax=Shinella kummerowiae TaxID=417745 RepID=A0A6N8SGE0_9HYPH|nr:aldose 1-epimerase [Shinella kummerowiae]MXN46366.1 aldose 1-epimerase [Shinella kummerowiae]